MAKDSKIEWTHHTFNPWWGCSKVSPACKHCYAETWAKRVGSKVWGAKASRRFFTDKHWAEPLKWNKEATKDGKRRRVFCASMADVFERRKELTPWRDRLWELIEETPMLDWLILTKRPQNIAAMVPWGDEWPENVWLGSTVENQTWAEKRLPILLSFPAKVRFLSCEPLLGNLDLSKFVNDEGLHPIDWVIAGGESGPYSRPMKPIWARNLRDQCLSSNIAFHFKQWGHWVPQELLTEEQKKVVVLDGEKLAAVGKGKAGRNLDGRTWDELPTKAVGRPVSRPSGCKKSTNLSSCKKAI